MRVAKTNKYIIEAIIGNRNLYNAHNKYQEEDRFINNDPRLNFTSLMDIDPLAYLVEALEDSGCVNPYSLVSIPIIKANMSNTVVYDNIHNYYLRTALNRYFNIYLSSLSVDTSLARYSLGNDNWLVYKAMFISNVCPILASTKWDASEFAKHIDIPVIPDVVNMEEDRDLKYLYFQCMGLNNYHNYTGKMSFENITIEQVNFIKSKLNLA